MREQFDDVSMAHIKTFLNVAETLSMSQSARELFIGQPTVSKRIAELETIIGVQLFDRSSNRLSLTYAGEFLKGRLSELYGEIINSVYDAKAYDKGYTQQLNICVDTLGNIGRLYKAVVLFRKNNPHVELNIETDMYNVKKLISRGKIDLAFTDYELGGIYERELEYQFVKDYELCAVVHKSHPLAKRETLTVADLEGIPLVAPEDDITDNYKRTLERMFSEHHLNLQISKTVKSMRLEYQALFNNSVVIMLEDTINENSKEALALMRNELRVFPLDYVIRSGFCWNRARVKPLVKEFLRIFNTMK